MYPWHAQRMREKKSLCTVRRRKGGSENYIHIAVRWMRKMQHGLDWVFANWGAWEKEQKEEDVHLCGGRKWMVYSSDMLKRRKNEQLNFSTKIVTDKRRNGVQKLTSNTMTLELENLGKYLYKAKRIWEHKVEKLVQDGKEEIL